MALSTLPLILRTAGGLQRNVSRMIEGRALFYSSRRFLAGYRHVATLEQSDDVVAPVMNLNLRPSIVLFYCPCLVAKI
jgi:hypothetical protein